jgi:ABC-type phosphate transport system substrate-binding protein
VRPTLIISIVVLAMFAREGSLARANDVAIELVVVVNSANTMKLTGSTLENVFLRKTTSWDDGVRVIPINGLPDSTRRLTFDRAVLGMSPDEVARYWLDLRIRGGGSAPREVDDPIVTLKLVGRLPGAIGYVPAGVALDGVTVVAHVRGTKVTLP